MAGLSHSMDFTHEQRQWISPVLIEANQVLLLSRTELQAAMRAEIMKNPALELDFDSPTGDETRQCPICGEALHNGWCAMCHGRPQEAPAREIDPRGQACAYRDLLLGDGALAAHVLHADRLADCAKELV